MWKIYGFLIRKAWKTYGKHTIYGKRMEKVWKICGFPNLEGTENIQYMENVWKMYGK